MSLRVQVARQRRKQRELCALIPAMLGVGDHRVLMRTESEHVLSSKARLCGVSIVLPVVLLLLVVALCFAYRPLVGSWHFYQMERCYREALKVGPTSSAQGELVRAYVYHRDRLVKLGWLEERVFRLRHVRPASGRQRELWQAARQLFPNHFHLALRKSGDGGYLELVVWDRPERMREWERFVVENDVPDMGVGKIAR
jgi:hypothetical protein